MNLVFPICQLYGFGQVNLFKAELGGLGCGTVVENLPTMQEALGLIPQNHTKKSRVGLLPKHKKKLTVYFSVNDLIHYYSFYLFGDDSYTLVFTLPDTILRTLYALSHNSKR